MSDETDINTGVKTNPYMAKKVAEMRKMMIKFINQRIENVQGNYPETKRLTEAIDWVRAAAPADLLQYTELVADEAEKTKRIPSPN